MSAHADSFTISTRGKGTYEITRRVHEIVAASRITTGTATVFVRHTSCSLLIFENADPSAREDLHAFFEHLVPENIHYLVHTMEGPDDMPSHLIAGNSFRSPLPARRAPHPPRTRIGDGE